MIILSDAVLKDKFGTSKLVFQDSSYCPPFFFLLFMTSSMPLGTLLQLTHRQRLPFSVFPNFLIISVTFMGSHWSIFLFWSHCLTAWETHLVGHICKMSIWASHWTEESSSTLVRSTSVDVPCIGVYTISFVDSLSVCPFESIHPSKPSHNWWWLLCIFTQHWCHKEHVFFLHLIQFISFHHYLFIHFMDLLISCLI